MHFRVQNSYLCNILWNSNEKTYDGKLQVIINDIRSKNSFSEDQLSKIKTKLICSFLPQYCKKWHNVSRIKNRFLKRYAQFLENYFFVELTESSNDDKQIESASSQSNRINRNQKSGPGRPRLSYEEGCSKTKQRRIVELASAHSKEQLNKALKLKDRQIDRSIGCEIDKTDDYNESNINNILAMYVDLDLTKRKYEKLKSHNERITGTKLYPPYVVITEAKKLCYPEHDHLKSSDLGASVNFISLLGHTAKRILLGLEKDDLANLANKKILLVGKWGMDGSSGQQTTRQTWSYQNVTNKGNKLSDTNSSDDDSDDHANLSDKTVFVISFVPLQLQADNNVIWINKTPSSIHFCRPVKFIFAKESRSRIIKEYNYYNNLLQKVQVYTLEVEKILFEISFDIKCTMIDGKVCNVLTGQKSSNCCNICNVGPKFINNLSHVTKLPCNENFYKFGISTLHCWIRCLEYLLHISYNLDIKKGSARTQEDKASKAARKKYIQQGLKSKLSLTVDVIKQGFGTTNTGNVARSFFAEAETVAEVTGLNKNLIERFHNILQVLTSGQMIDCARFKSYSFKTAEMCIQLYSWYPLPPSIHKILIHGSEIVKEFNLPIGWFSEEPQEGNNKTFRKCRAHNSRMSDRRLTNIDILHYLLIASDPLISNLRIKDDRKRKALS